jgi:alpha-glucosidase
VRPGAILPRQPLVPSLAETPRGALELGVHPGPDCKGELYWDDGRSLRRDDAAVLRQEVRCETTPNGRKVVFEPRRGGCRPWWNGLHVAVYGWRNATAQAKLDGKPVAAAFAPDPGVLSVDLPDQPGPAVLSLQ